MKNNSTKALVLIEFQKQWTEKGRLHLLIKKHLNSRNVLNKTLEAVQEPRKRGLKIIHDPLIIDPQKKKGWYSRITFGKFFTKDSWKSEIIPEMINNEDAIVKGRTSFDAFKDSNLDEILRENGIKTIFRCGFTTDQCVLKTLRSARKRKYGAYLNRECTATFNSFFRKKLRKEQKQQFRYLTTIR